MIVGKRLALVAAAALTCTGLISAGTASADTPKKAPPAQPGVTVVATGLNGPRQLSATSKYVYVAESDAGQVSRVTKKTGAVKLQVTGANLAQGVVRTDGRFYIASGEEAPDEARAVNGSSEILVAKTGRKPRTFADLLAYELKRNPDNQTQFGPDGRPLDALSNPYYVVRSKFKGQFLLAADAGGNDVLAISKKGKVSTFFVPPAVTTGACGSTPQNSDAGPSCDAVPTGLAFGPDGNLYVSALTSLTPNEGRVYVVNKNGKLVRTWTGFSGPTGVAVGPDGSVYVSELLEGAPAEPAARSAQRSDLPTGRVARAAADEPAFDPTTIGQVVKVAPNGGRTYAQVTMPAGLLYTDGKLYASAWAVAGQLGIPNAGQVVTIARSAFKAQ
jgi:hypothetical protein